ncbi:unnamed protein product [Ectocarpus sp. 13 AM-2016]
MLLHHSLPRCSLYPTPEGRLVYAYAHMHTAAANAAATSRTSVETTGHCPISHGCESTAETAISLATYTTTTQRVSVFVEGALLLAVGKPLVIGVLLLETQQLLAPSPETHPSWPNPPHM